MTNDESAGTSTGTRLQAIIKHSKQSQIDFSKQLGISQGYLSQILMDKRDLSGFVLKNFAIAFKQYSLKWLLINEGTMLREEKTEEATTTVEEPRAGYAATGVLLSDLPGIIDYVLTELASLTTRVEAVEAAKG